MKNAVFSGVTPCGPCNVQYIGGTRQRHAVKHYVISRKVAGSISDEVIGLFFRFT
jgi:hypothetical protein